MLMCSDSSTVVISVLCSVTLMSTNDACGAFWLSGYMEAPRFARFSADWEETSSWFAMALVPQRDSKHLIDTDETNWC